MNFSGRSEPPIYADHRHVRLRHRNLHLRLETPSLMRRGCHWPASSVRCIPSNLWSRLRMRPGSRLRPSKDPGFLCDPLRLPAGLLRQLHRPLGRQSLRPQRGRRIPRRQLDCWPSCHPVCQAVAERWLGGWPGNPLAWFHRIYRRSPGLDTARLRDVADCASNWRRRLRETATATGDCRPRDYRLPEMATVPGDCPPYTVTPADVREAVEIVVAPPPPPPPPATPEGSHEHADSKRNRQPGGVVSSWRIINRWVGIV